MKEMHKCPVCGNDQLLEEWEFCDVCGWQMDFVQYDKPDYAGGANHMSVNQAREAYAKGEPIN